MAPATAGTEGGQSGFRMMGGSGGSGGGATPPDLPPVISGGAAGANGGTTNGSGNIPPPVPVGANIGFLVRSSDSAYEIDTTQVTWSGGTDYKTYNLQPAANPPPTSQQLVKGVATNGLAYNFIVDATPRQYTIKVDVKYKNGAKGSSTLTFTSAKPVYEFTNTQPGSVVVKFANVPGRNPPERVVVAGVPEPPMGYGDRQVKFTAKTGPETASTLAGDYMILQLIDYNNGRTDNLGNNTSFDTGGYVIDDGQPSPTIFSPTPIGQPVSDQAGTINLGSSWTQAVGMPQTSRLNKDNPYVAVPVIDKSISVDGAFMTYLMYKPAGGVWIALSRFDWNLKASATNSTPNDPDNYFWTHGVLVDPSPAQKTPSDDEAFPVWTTDLFSTQWN